MNVQNKKKSSYVITGNPSFLPSGGLAPPIKEGKPPGSMVSHAQSIAYDFHVFNNIFAPCGVLFAPYSHFTYLSLYFSCIMVKVPLFILTNACDTFIIIRQVFCKSSGTLQRFPVAKFYQLRSLGSLIYICITM